MPRLYCTKDGEEYSQFLATEALENFEGEGVTVTKGRVIVEGCLCDKCGFPIKYEETGYLICYWLPDMEEEFANYDFGYESKYLDFERKDIKLFGWDWLK